MVAVVREFLDMENIAKMRAERGNAAVVGLLCEALDPKNEVGPGKPGLSLEQMSIRELAYATGCVSPYRNDWGQFFSRMRSEAAHIMESEHFTESNPGVNTNAFRQITTAGIRREMIAAYEVADSSFIGDQLAMNMPSRGVRNQKIGGATALGGPEEVLEGHPYLDTTFEEKWVSTKESKKGRIVRINEELIEFDQTGEIVRRARMITDMIRQERERTIVRGVCDMDSTAYVYRPSGVATQLFKTDGSQYNWIGSGNTTSTAFNAASALADWTDIQWIKRYRSTAVLDDRIDGTKRPIVGLNGPEAILLVPEALAGVAAYISNAIEIQMGADTAAVQGRMGNPVAGLKWLSSPFIDENVGTDAQAVNDYFFGLFKKQYLWTEIWPFQVFEQGANSEAAFERDTVLAVKGRYYGGLTAVDTRYVTKIDGA